ncbi:MAG: hypothetical protein ACJ73S_01405 [Mycobacteriales bacterium]
MVWLEVAGDEPVTGAEIQEGCIAPPGTGLKYSLPTTLAVDQDQFRNLVDTLS